MEIDNKFTDLPHHSISAPADIRYFEIQENWDFYLDEIDGIPSSYFLNLALAQNAPVQPLSNLIWVALQMNHPREDGLSSSEEYDLLLELEDALIPAMTKNKLIVYVGRVTRDTKRLFFFYAAPHINAEQSIQSAMQAFPDYHYSFGKKSDRDWNIYFRNLYPNEVNLQMMSNSKVLESLRNNGDSLEIARPIDHWIYFKSLNEQSNFIKKVEDLGFAVVEKTTVEENENYPYKLIISRKDHVDQLSIDQCTLVLFELAKQENAQYDGWETQVIRN